MGNGYPVFIPEGEEIGYEIREIRRRLRELEALDGSQINDTVQQLKKLIEGALNPTSVTTPGDVTSTGGYGNFAAGVTSAGVYNLDVSALSGSRRANWTHVSGQIGYAPSTIRKKANLEEFPVPAETFLSLSAYLFQYKALIDIRDNPDNPNYDPGLVVPAEPGLIAEHLVAAGLGMFVFFADDGVTPEGINYDYFAAVGLVVVGRSLATRLSAVEAALGL